MHAAQRSPAQLKRPERGNRAAHEMKVVATEMHHHHVVIVWYKGYARVWAVDYQAVDAQPKRGKLTTTWRGRLGQGFQDLDKDIPVTGLAAAVVAVGEICVDSFDIKLHGSKPIQQPLLLAVHLLSQTTLMV